MNYKSSPALIIVEIEKNGRVYSFNMPQGCAVGEAYDAAFEVLQAIISLANDAAQKAKPKEESAKAVENPINKVEGESNG